MDEQSPFKIEIFDGACGFRGTVGNPLALVPTPRFNAQSTASMTLSSKHEMNEELQQPGCRYRISYLGAHLTSGWVSLLSAKGPQSGASVTYELKDDYCLIGDLLAWPKPSAAGGTANDKLAAQTDEYRIITGPAESVLKTVVAENRARVGGLPLTIAPNLNRGGTITVKWRMDPIDEPLMPLFTAAGVGVTVKQVGAGLVLDCYTPSVYPTTLTEASGVVQDYEYTAAAPEATRFIIGGRGEGVARKFRQVVDAPREAAWARRVERFRDATDVEQNATENANLDARGVIALAESGRRAGISLRLNQTPDFHYDPTGADGFRVGDVVTIEVTPGFTITETLTEATLSWTADNGVTVTPLVGQDAGVERRLINTIERVDEAIRRTLSRR